MNFERISTSPARRRFALIAGAALMAAVMIAANGLVLKASHDSTGQGVHDNLQSRSLTLAESAERIFQSIDIVLAEVNGYVRRQGIADGDTLQQMLGDQGTHRLLAEKIAALSYVRDVMLIGLDGTMVNSAGGWPPRPLELADRDDVQALLQNPDLRVAVGRPVRHRASGAWSVVLARRLLDADNKIVGVAAATVSLDRFEEFYRSTTVGSGHSVSLLRDDGMLLARHPASPRIGTLRPARMLDAPAAGHHALYRSISPVDGQRRIVSARALRDYPLVVIVAQIEHAAFAGWRTVALVLSLVTLAFLAMVALSAVMIGRSWRQQDRVAESERNRAIAESDLKRGHELALQHMRFTAAAESMTLGLSLFDAGQRLIACNTSYARMYGLPAELARPGTELKALLAYRVAHGSHPVGQPAGQPVDTNRGVADWQRDIAAAVGPTVERLADGRWLSILRRPLADGGWVSTHEDITERRQAERELYDTKRFLDLIIENIPAAVVVKNAADRRIVLVNRAYENFFEMPRGDLVGRTVFELPLSPKDATRIDGLDHEALEAADAALVNEFTMDAGAKGERHVSTSRLVVRADDGSSRFLVIVFEDITERKIAERNIAFLAHHDPLTGLANRAALRERMAEAFARQRRRGECFTLLLLDLDRFKLVNDTFGHPAGDALLVEVAQRLRALLRETDVLGRLGGDEFAVLQVGEAGQRDAATRLARRIVDGLAAPFRIDGRELNIGVSIGIAMAPEHAGDGEGLMKAADLALYRAKQEGRNGFRVFEPAMGLVTGRRQAMEAGLRHAIAV